MTGFIKPNCQLTVGEIAALTHAKLRDGDPADRRIGNIAPLDSAGPAGFSGDPATTADSRSRPCTCALAARPLVANSDDGRSISENSLRVTATNAG